MHRQNLGPRGFAEEVYANAFKGLLELFELGLADAKPTAVLHLNRRWPGQDFDPALEVIGFAPFSVRALDGDRISGFFAVDGKDQRGKAQRFCQLAPQPAFVVGGRQLFQPLGRFEFSLHCRGLLEVSISEPADTEEARSSHGQISAVWKPLATVSRRAVMPSKILAP
jgi:hypothetical protein